MVALDEVAERERVELAGVLVEQLHLVEAPVEGAGVLEVEDDVSGRAEVHVSGDVEALGGAGGERVAVHLADGDQVGDALGADDFELNARRRTAVTGALLGLGEHAERPLVVALRGRRSLVAIDSDLVLDDLVVVVALSALGRLEVLVVFAVADDRLAAATSERHNSGASAVGVARLRRLLVENGLDLGEVVRRLLRLLVVFRRRLLSRRLAILFARSLHQALDARIVADDVGEAEAARLAANASVEPVPILAARRYAAIVRAVHVDGQTERELFVSARLELELLYLCFLFMSLLFYVFFVV